MPSFLAPQTPLVNEAIIPTRRATGGNADQSEMPDTASFPTLFYGAHGILHQLSKQVNQINTRGCQ